jgi:hypothetical protein
MLLINAEEIAYELTVASEKLDQMLEGWVFRRGFAIAVPVIPSPLLLECPAIVQQKNYERFVRNLYDHYILFFPETTIVRGIRYKGKRQFNVNKLFKIEKLKKQKEPTSKLGMELLGSFITEGDIENVDGVSFDKSIKSIEALLPLIRPLLLKPDILIPSPLSIIAHEVSSRGTQRKYYLAPATIITIIKDLQFKKEFNILSEKQTGLYSEDSLMLAFDVNNLLIHEVKVKIFIPKQIEEQCKSIQSLKRLVSQGIPVVIGLQGVFIIECDKPLLQFNTSTGYFLALRKVDVVIDIEALSIYGEVQCHSFQQIKSDRAGPDFCYAIRCKKIHLDNFKSTVISYFRKLKNDVHMLLNLYYSKFVDTDIMLRFSIENDNYLELMAPPLITNISMGVIEFAKIFNLLKVLEKLSHTRGIEQLMMLYNNPEIKYLSRMLESPWHKALKIQHEFATKKNLLYVL